MWLKGLVIAITTSTLALAAAWVVVIAGVALVVKKTWDLIKAIKKVREEREISRKYEEDDFSKEDLKQKKFRLKAMYEEFQAAKSINDENERAIALAKHYLEWNRPVRRGGTYSEQAQRGLQLMKEQGLTAWRQGYYNEAGERFYMSVGLPAALPYAGEGGLRGRVSRLQSVLETVPPGTAATEANKTVSLDEQSLSTLQNIIKGGTTINANFDIENLDPNVDIPGLIQGIADLQGQSSRNS